MPDIDKRTKQCWIILNSFESQEFQFPLSVAKRLDEREKNKVIDRWYVRFDNTMPTQQWRTSFFFVHWTRLDHTTLKSVYHHRTRENGNEALHETWPTLFFLLRGWQGPDSWVPRGEFDSDSAWWWWRKGSLEWQILCCYLAARCSAVIQLTG